MEENKDIIRLTKLYEEYEKQKLRVIKIMEYDSKRIGIKRLAKEMHVNWSYLYRIFDGEYISYDKIVQIYNEIQSIKKIFGLEDEV